MKKELMGTRYPLNDRLRLFHGTVTPTILYGCEAWTMMVELENRIRRTQRQILRMLLHAPRRAVPAPPQPRNIAHSTKTSEQDERTLTDTNSSTDHDLDSNGSTTPAPPHSEAGLSEDLEPWADWFRRCTREMAQRMKTVEPR